MSAPAQSKTRTPSRSRARGRSTARRPLSHSVDPSEVESDIPSETSTTSASGGRRRRNRKGKRGNVLPSVDENGMPQPPQDLDRVGAPGQVQQQQQQQGQQKEEDGGGGGDAMSLRLDLNLDVWLELKAKVHGDVTLALL
ncbi:hypothetical protein PLICRDRAFT_124140 [Plicaturopsis crispa FD-325 SS-3]|nr:hypothetical protein PLICRDRAFT_124140 [Plicaturopsis crispa FD-325 SS-3]